MILYYSIQVRIIPFDIQYIFLSFIKLFLIYYYQVICYMVLLILNCHCILTLALCIYDDSLNILIKLFPYHLYLDNKIYSQSYSIPCHLQLNTCLVLQLLFNLSPLFATPTIYSKTKSQLSTLLIIAFEHKVIDIQKFSLIIDAKYIHHYIRSYKRHIKSYKAVINGI